MFASWVALLAGCELSNPVIETLASDIQLDTVWLTLPIDPPLRPRRATQRISIDVADVASWDVSAATSTFTTPAGATLEIDVRLVAADGRAFALTELGLGPGLTFAYGGKGSLPDDVDYVELRARASASWRGGAVRWIDLTNY